MKREKNFHFNEKQVIRIYMLLISAYIYIKMKLDWGTDTSCFSQPPIESIYWELLAVVWESEIKSQVIDLHPVNTARRCDVCGEFSIKTKFSIFMRATFFFMNDIYYHDDCLWLLPTPSMDINTAAAKWNNKHTRKLF